MKTETLRIGTILQHGDEYMDPYTGKWHPTKCAGKRVGIPNCTTGIYRRPVAEAAVAVPAEPTDDSASDEVEHPKT